MTDPFPPYLWGAWRCTANPDFFTAWCGACGGELWMSWAGERWQVSCAHGCALEDIDAAAQRLAEAKRAEHGFNREARATMEPDDPFYGIPAEDYIHALTGLEATRGFFCCPFHGDGRERTPSLHVTGIFWHCQGCKRGGSIYDFGAELWGITPRREGFSELRQRLGTVILGAAT